MTTSSEVGPPSEERLHLLYQNANTLRMHQDNLRWTLAAGYFAALGAGATLLKPNEFPLDVSAYVPAFLFILSLFFLLILAVESWWYNIFSDYVEQFDMFFTRSESFVVGLSKYRDSIKKTTTPFHESFIFVLAIVAITNVFFLHRVLAEHGVSGGLERLVLALWILILILACRFWNQITHRLFLSKLAWLFSQPNKKFNERPEKRA